MKTKTCLLAFCIFLFIPFSNLFAQKSFKPGAIITNENEEIKGLINIRGLNSEPFSIIFKETDTSRVLTCTPSNIKSFRYGADYYVSASVACDVLPGSVDKLFESQYTPSGLGKKAYFEANRISTQKLIPNGDVQYKEEDSICILRPHNVQVSAFLKTLVTGTIDLYYFRDNEYKEHYYISTEEGVYEELNRIFYAENLQTMKQSMEHYLIVYEVEFFKPQLLHYMAGDNSFESRIKNTLFNQRSLSGLIVDYNNTFGIEKGNMINPPADNAFNFGIVAGIGFFNVKFLSTANSLKYIDFGYKPCYTFGGKAEVIFPGLKERFALSADVSIRYFKTEGTGSKPTYTYSSEFEILSTRIAPMLKVKILSGDVAPYVGGGLFYSLIHKIDNSITETHYGISVTRDAIESSATRNQEQGMMVCAGLQLKEFTFEGQLELGNGYSKAYSLDSKTKTFLFTVSYSF